MRKNLYHGIRSIYNITLLTITLELTGSAKSLHDCLFYINIVLSIELLLIHLLTTS